APGAARRSRAEARDAGCKAGRDFLVALPLPPWRPVSAFRARTINLGLPGSRPQHQRRSVMTRTIIRRGDRPSTSRALRQAASLAMLAAVCAPVPAALAQADSAITYQGVLSEASQRYTGTADFRFQLWDDEVGGTKIGPEVTSPAVNVEAGLFDTVLEFGADALADGRWLEIQVRTPAWSGAGAPPPLTTLAPRQPVTGAPYSVSTRGIFVDADQRVGVGTASPQSALHVVGDESTGTTGALRITSGSQTMLLDG